MFRLICPPHFFRCLSNSGTFTELQITCFIVSTGDIYRQEEGLAMDSPQSPVLANIHMEYFEEMALGSKSLKPSMWLRYVDDTFILCPHQKFNMTKNCVYSIPCSCGKIYKPETGHPLKVRLEEHRKAVVRGEIEKSGIVDHIWKEKGNHLPLWDKVEIIVRAEHWRIRRIKGVSTYVGLQWPAK